MTETLLSTKVTISIQQIKEFLYYESELLDEWKLVEWSELFTDDGTYVVPPLGNPEADPAKSIFYINDTRSRLKERAERLLKKEAHVEYPHSTTIRNVNNVRIKGQEGDSLHVRCNFSTYRTKREVLDCFVGVNDYKLIVKDDKIMIQDKKVTLKHDSLRPHGKISLIL
ncbi:p-cumate dioxygenase [Sporosarcina sp. P18a]|uniref:aromatic-ring-hydroxylating dioxygenase subunit beta n=1 Tax=unclassified Sporosarcina TaxID=2647733 RepID=UPI000C169BF4|nr:MULTISPECIES: aromatic-ring-hydroxylating dioxygenase subunit beta [unclassified Sporosarcina]PIC78784.1 p-cumate dioxygenase [Sporosarcina sp. P18a]PID02969.1 p-cumate dioxygenase [Sporosarcina sp. P2]PID24059.1 p-cumate dioxygenase [Sporosarcina sp. P7]